MVPSMAPEYYLYPKTYPDPSDAGGALELPILLDEDFDIPPPPPLKDAQYQVNSAWTRSSTSSDDHGSCSESIWTAASPRSSGCESQLSLDFESLGSFCQFSLRLDCDSTSTLIGDCERSPEGITPPPARSRIQSILLPEPPLGISYSTKTHLPLHEYGSALLSTTPRASASSTLSSRQISLPKSRIVAVVPLARESSDIPILIRRPAHNADDIIPDTPVPSLSFSPNSANSPAPSTTSTNSLSASRTASSNGRVRYSERSGTSSAVSDGLPRRKLCYPNTAAAPNQSLPDPLFHAEIPTKVGPTSSFPSTTSPTSTNFPSYDAYGLISPLPTTSVFLGCPSTEEKSEWYSDSDDEDTFAASTIKLRNAFSRTNLRLRARANSARITSAIPETLFVLRRSEDDYPAATPSPDLQTSTTLTLRSGISSAHTSLPSPTFFAAHGDAPSNIPTANLSRESKVGTTTGEISITTTVSNPPPPMTYMKEKRGTGPKRITSWLMRLLS